MAVDGDDVINRKIVLIRKWPLNVHSDRSRSGHASSGGTSELEREVGVKIHPVDQRE